MSILRRLYNISKSYGYSFVDKLKKKKEDIPLNMFDDFDETETIHSPKYEYRTRDPQLAQYYANLETPYGSDKETVTRAWKGLLRRYHPDLHSSDTEKKQIATDLTQKLNEAYNEISKALLEGRV